MEDERFIAGNRFHRPGVLLGLKMRILVRREVGRVTEARPFVLVGIPPDVALALRPRPPIGIGGRPVVEDPDVLGPRPPPLGRDPVLLSARLLACRLVDAVLEDAAVDPRAAGGRAVA